MKYQKKIQTLNY